MSSLRSAERRERDGVLVEAREEVAAEFALAHVLVAGRGAWRTRRARRRCSAVVAPSGKTSFAWSTRRSLACASSGMSPISSRKSVPPSASLMRPGLSRSAPENAPRR